MINVKAFKCQGMFCIYTNNGSTLPFFNDCINQFQVYNKINKISNRVTSPYFKTDGSIRKNCIKCERKKYNLYLLASRSFNREDLEILNLGD